MLLFAYDFGTVCLGNGSEFAWTWLENQLRQLSFVFCYGNDPTERSEVYELCAIAYFSSDQGRRVALPGCCKT